MNADVEKVIWESFSKMEEYFALMGGANRYRSYSKVDIPITILILLSEKALFEGKANRTLRDVVAPVWDHVEIIEKVKQELCVLDLSNEHDVVLSFSCITRVIGNRKRILLESWNDQLSKLIPQIIIASKEYINEINRKNIDRDNNGGLV